MDEHLSDNVDKVEWPDKPELPIVPEGVAVSVEEDEYESDNVSSKWSED